MLTGRDLLSLADFTPSELSHVLDIASEQKELLGQGEPLLSLDPLVAALIFMKPSIRTRVSFEVACTQLGVAPVVLGPQDAFSRGETVEDTTHVLERYVDAIVIRTFAHDQVERIAAAADVPVINALTDDFHPCQGLADLLTIREHKGTLKGMTLTYVGDGNNVAATLALAGSLSGMHVRIGSPIGYCLPPSVVLTAETLAQEGGGTLQLIQDPREAVEGADVVYADTWASMGQEDERARRLVDLDAYRVDETLMTLADPEAIFMHCLPAHRGEEVTDQVIDAPYSVVFDQAENRLHAQRALLATILG